MSAGWWLRRKPSFSQMRCIVAVLGEDVADDPLERLVAADLDEAAEQLGAQPLALETVADEQGELGLVRAAQLAQPADAEDLVRRRSPGPCGRPPGPSRGRSR